VRSQARCGRRKGNGPFPLPRADTRSAPRNGDGSEPTRIAAGTVLFGVWTVETTYGRIGTPGRTIRQAVPEEATAMKLVWQHLRRQPDPKVSGHPAL
jgi:hypothetical protein